MPIEIRGDVSCEKIVLVNKLSAQVQIRSVRLVDATVRQSARVLRDSPPELMDVQAKTTQEIDTDSSDIRVMVFLTLRGSYDKSEQFEPPLLVKAQFELAYQAKSLDGISSEHLNAFGELNGVYNCWPYWREFVQSSMGRMGLPPLTIPIFRPVFVPPPAKEVEETKTARIDTKASPPAVKRLPAATKKAATKKTPPAKK